MTMLQGEVLGYDYDRMVVNFTMLDDSAIVVCAISTAAMDDIEHARGVNADQRVDQFLRLRDVIEARATRKFIEEPGLPGRPLVLRSNDFAKSA
jgi:hypothetical protein